MLVFSLSHALMTQGTPGSGSYCVSMKHEEASQLVPFLPEPLFHAQPHPSTATLKGAPSSLLTVATGKPGEHIPS